MRRLRVLGLLLSLAATLPARREPALCGTTPEIPGESLFLHRVRKGLRPRAVAAASRNRDIGNIAIIEDADGIVARQNEFNLDGKTLRFTPSGAGYRYTVLDGGYDAAPGVPVAALDDDDARKVALPFNFPFFGANYREFCLNSDGNLTFLASDTASSDRSLGRTTSGPPRIFPLFDDLNPAETAGGVRVLAETGRVVVSWVGVPEWVAAGIGMKQTFQVALYPDGRIDFSYNGVNPGSAVVGIAPGGLKGTTALVDFRNDASGVYTAAVAERFGNSLAIDVVTVAQRFYQTHEDAYDYLVIYNNMDIPALTGGVIAYESTVRNRGQGYGVDARDDGAQYGSAARLQAVLNMGPLGQYPKDPAGLVPGRAAAGDTPITTLAHETGHLFLAYASVPDPDDPAARPMLGYQNQHWGFLFNSEASLLEGERIEDRGPGVSPRFLTTATVEAYAPLDQYLMGWRPLAEVPNTFYVDGPAQYRNLHPQRGVGFDGVRHDVAAAEVAQTMGRRTPDHTVAQRRFRFAFILVTPPGADPSLADLAQLEVYRREFEPFFAKASSDRAGADASLKRALRFSIPGVVVGTTVTATVSVGTAPTADLRLAGLPQSVTIPAGATSATFQFPGTAAGVVEVTAVPSDSAYETAYARVQVAGAAELQLVQVSADPVIVRLTDANGLLYPGAGISAATSSGMVSPAFAITDAQGLVTFRWTPGAAASNQLQLTLDAVPAVGMTVRAGRAVPVIAAVVNAASYMEGIAAGTLQTIFGANLAGATVSLDGVPLAVSYTGDGQINFYVPATAHTGAATLAVTAPSGERATRAVDVAAVQPGIFGVRATGDGYLEIYCTGIGSGAPLVFIGAVPVQPLYTGAVPGTPGLYQVNVRIPPGAGPRAVLLSVNLAHSNEVSLP